MLKAKAPSFLGFPIVESPASPEPPDEIVLVDPFRYYVYGTVNGEPFKMVRSEYEQMRRDNPEWNLPEPPPLD